MASPPTPRDAQDIESAGAVVLAPGRRVLLVHRPAYDDWSFPKGKLDPGEHRTAAAVREVEEETGLHVRLGVPLRGQRYAVVKGMKTVYYWVARPVADPDISDYVPNAEIDQVEWVPVAEAAERLTYPHDRDTLEEALAARRRTRTLVVLRHGKARSRRGWHRDDRLRPLVSAGRQAAQDLVPLLAAYDVRRLVCSGSERCVETLTPYADLTERPLETDDRLSEEDASAASVAELVDDVLAGLREPTPAPGEGGTVLCTHRPVLPLVFGRLGVADPGLEPGEMLVLHLRRGTVMGIERHRPH